MHKSRKSQETGNLMNTSEKVGCKNLTRTLLCFVFPSFFAEENFFGFRSPPLFGGPGFSLIGPFLGLTSWPHSHLPLRPFRLKIPEI